MVEIQNEIEGSILYLQKKSKILFGIGKIFVIIRTTPENQDTVIQTLRMKLEEKQMTATTNLGLVLYECK